MGIKREQRKIDKERTNILREKRLKELGRGTKMEGL